MIDQFQTFLLLGVTLLLAYIVIRVVHVDLRQDLPPARAPARPPGTAAMVDSGS